MIGKTLGHYRIMEKIGGGGMGEVHRARDERLDRDVALKVLPAGLLADKAARKRFRKEALALSKLNHPNIATVYDFDTQAGVDFLVMEYIGGETLEKKLGQGLLAEKEVGRLGSQLAEGLAAAHGEGVVHRDLKPGNLRVTADGRLKILDFGLARLLRPAESAEGAATTESMTEASRSFGTVAGTLPYMAPEQLRGEPVDARTDIYGTGVVLYEMATGRRPFQEKLATALADDILHKPAPPPGRLNPDLSSRLEEIIRKCLEKEPEHRYQSARDLLADFRRLSLPPSPQGPPPAAELRGERLESWKEIGAYLKRDPRTVQRWEKNAGLPVHRHPSDKVANVFAYTAELDAWWATRQPKLEAKEAEEAKERRKRWAVAAAAVVVIAAGVGYWWLAQAPVLPFAERDWVLIAQFENRTGEVVFDGTLEYALERELANSRFVNVVPRERINDTLQLMKRPLDTTIDHNVGREICLRDGGIRGLVTGRVEKLDTTYVLSASLVEPGRGVTVGSFSEEAEGQKEVVAAIRRLAARVRETLGEDLASIEASGQQLEKVTTRSLRALQLYSHATRLHNEFQYKQAAELLRQAVEEDPDFASAHVLLAYSLSILTKPQEAARHLQRAYELADTTTDRERYFILATYYEEEDPDKAIQTFELLLRLYPDHYWAVTNLSHLYLWRGQPRRALPYTLRRADLRPNNFDHQLRAAHALLLWGERAQAEPYLRRAQALVSQGSVDPWRAAWLRLFPVHEQWLRGDFSRALEELEAVVRNIQVRNKGEQNALRWEVGSFYLTLGKVQAAKEMFAGMSGPEELALIGWGLGEEPTVREHLRRAPPSYRAAILLCRAGLLAEARKAISSPEAVSSAYAPFLPNVWDTLARGELALAKGETKEAIRLLEPAVRTLRTWPTAYFFLGSEALARAWEQQGNPAKALEVLESAAEYKRPAVFWGPAPFFWMRNQVRLAQLYRKVGREQEAQAIEAELRKLLADADPDHPILRQLNASRNVAVTQPPK